MPWFRLDDSFHSHPKVIAAGNEAIGLFIRCGTYAAQNLTDGAVRRDIAVLYGAETHPWGADGSRGTETLGDILVKVGLWHRTRAGWRIHDYLDYNFSREQVLKERKAAAERQRKWKQARQHGEGNAVSNAVTNAAPSRPVPGFTADVVNRPNGSNQARASPETTDAVKAEIRETTGRLVDDAWAARVAADILGGRSVASPAAYVRQAIRKEPGRFLPARQPPPVADVLPKPAGRHARKDTST